VDWVQNCYGASPYYKSLYSELQEMMQHSEIRDAEVTYHEIDIDNEAGTLKQFLVSRQINAANLSYVLYELSTEARERVTRSILRSLSAPYLVIEIEPLGELGRQGCVVVAHTPEGA